MLWKNIKLHLYANANKCGKSYQQRPERFLSDVRVHLGETLRTCHLSQKCYWWQSNNSKCVDHLSGMDGIHRIEDILSGVYSSSKYWLRLSRVFLPEIDHLALIVLFTSNNLNQGPGYIFVVRRRVTSQCLCLIHTHSSQQLWARHCVLCLFVLIDPDPDTESLIGSLKARGR